LHSTLKEQRNSDQIEVQKKAVRKRSWQS